MIVTEQVEEAVKAEHFQLALQVAAAPFGLPARGVDRDHDIAEIVRLIGCERQHVGRLVVAAVVAVEFLDTSVAYERERGRRIGGADCRRDLGEELLERTAVDLVTSLQITDN